MSIDQTIVVNNALSSVFIAWSFMCYDVIAPSISQFIDLYMESLRFIYSSDFLPYWKCSMKCNSRDVYFFRYPSLGSSMYDSSHFKSEVALLLIILIQLYFL